MENKIVNWVIDKHLFTEYSDKLAHEVVKSGGNVHFYDDLTNGSFKDFLLKTFTEKDVVVLHGSLQQGKQISNLPIYPGTFITLDNYECCNYYANYGGHLLNEDYLMFGFNDLTRNKDKIIKYFDSFGIFIRPSNGYKTFAGQVINGSNFEYELKNIKRYIGEDNPLVLVSKCFKILEEYRFIIAEGEVVSGAKYFDKHNMGTFKPYYDKPCTHDDIEIIEYASDMAKLYQPDKAFTMDICKTDFGYRLLEINSFNCASMYGNNYSTVVEAINELAIKEYNDLFLPF